LKLLSRIKLLPVILQPYEEPIHLEHMQWYEH